MSKSPLLLFLTGLPRSGTTWAAQALAAATGGRIIHEPFNWRNYPARLPYHMLYRSAQADDPALLNIIKRSMRPSWKHAYDWLRPNRPLVLKDVHICLASEYIETHLRPRTIIIMRHPCAMAQSWHALKYEVPFRIETLLRQPDLVETYLHPFVSHLQDQDEYLRFQSLFERLNVALSPRHQIHLNQFLQSNNRPRKASEGAYSTARSSEAEPDKWRHKLTGEQIAAVLHGAAPFGLLEKFYPANSSDKQT
ncbi:MAG: hypothetical protein IPL78_15420 [Chloroflexi bacterium]|nr:hypothetical protein [Chloroflexota bacterium]